MSRIIPPTVGVRELCGNFFTNDIVDFTPSEAPPSIVETTSSLSYNGPRRQHVVALIDPRLPIAALISSLLWPSSLSYGDPRHPSSSTCHPLFTVSSSSLTCLPMVALISSMLRFSSSSRDDPHHCQVATLMVPRQSSLTTQSSSSTHCLLQRCRR